MESKKINQLATELAPELSDLTIIGDPTTGISKKITLSQMASLFTGTVEEYANLASFPLVGAADTIYIALDTNIIYRWNTSTSAYVELSPNIVTSLVFNDANGFDGTISLVGSTATLTITTALTTGSVGFIGASGALTQDNSNFFWDNSNKRLGINSNAPTTALDVFGSGIIGRVNGTSTNNAFLGFASAGSNKWSIGNVQSDHRFRIYNEATTSELVSVLQTGEFGIGIANPTTKLHIDGGASALIANLDANVSVAKSISFRSDNSARFNIEVSGTESGSDAGADFFIRRYSDAGSLLDTPFKITRSTGIVEILKNDRANGASLVITNSFNGSGWIAGDIIGSILFYSSDSSAIGNRGAIRSISESGSTSSSSTGLSFETYSAATLSQKMYLSGTGSLGIGSTSLTNVVLRISKNITGGTSSFGIYNESVIQSDVTSTATAFYSGLGTQATTFTLTNLRHFYVQTGTIGAGSSITTQVGFLVSSGMTGATNNYAFQGALASATNTWNLYMNGTASNYLAGKLLIGSTTDTGANLQVTGTGRFTGDVELNGSSGTRTLTIQNNTSGDAVLSLLAAGSNGGSIFYKRTTSELTFNNNAIDAFKIDASGFGTFQYNNASAESILNLTNTSTGSNVTKGSRLVFRLSDTVGTVKDSGYISVYPNTSKPNVEEAYMTFATRNADSAPAEKMRITNDGWVKASNTGTYITGSFHEFSSNINNATTFRIKATSSTFTDYIAFIQADKANNSDYSFLQARSSNTSDTEFNLRGDGNAYADGSWNGGGADYAEFFEWLDGNPNNEDRRGYSVSLVGNKIKIAQKGETIIGVISGNPSVIGDSAWNMWTEKYLRDDFGTYVRDEEGFRILNPNYNPDIDYISREERPEWGIVGLMGKLCIRKGQEVMPNWIKMQDISDNVEQWLIK